MAPLWGQGARVGAFSFLWAPLAFGMIFGPPSETMYLKIYEMEANIVENESQEAVYPVRTAQWTLPVGRGLWPLGWTPSTRSCPPVPTLSAMTALSLPAFLTRFSS